MFESAFDNCELNSASSAATVVVVQCASVHVSPVGIAVASKMLLGLTAGSENGWKVQIA